MSERQTRGRHVSKRPPRYQAPLSGLTTQEREVKQLRDTAHRIEHLYGDPEFAATLRQAADEMAARPDPEKEQS